MDDKRLIDLERRIAALEDSLRTQNSSPQDDVQGSAQRAFREGYWKGNGHVSRITLNAAGTGLTVEKVR